ncbi:MAG: lysozyme inhibitor LprI family protein [Brevefilum sp.]
MQLIKRHMQSISLLVIAGILLAIAFIISQQTRSGERRPELAVTSHVDQDTLGDIPTCTGLASSEEELSCYTEAAQVSEAWVLALADEIIENEVERAREVEFIEAQIAWEDSRDADCKFVQEIANAEGGDGLLEKLICLTEQNLARLERLAYYQHEWYCTEDCGEKIEAGH